MSKDLRESIEDINLPDEQKILFKEYLDDADVLFSDSEMNDKFTSILYKSKKSSRNAIMLFYRFAAMIAIVFSLYVFHEINNNKFSFFASLGDDLFFVNKGDIRCVNLVDGTKVWLNADSKLRFFNDNNSDTREVYLDGEAYFEVARDESKKFIIHTHNSKVQVLGTKFNIDAYKKEHIETSVISGKVKFSTSKSVVILTANTKAYSDASGVLTKSNNYISSDDIAWREGVFIFKSESLKNIVEELERAYNVVISIDKSVEDKNITASFKKDNIMNILQVMSYTNEFRFVKKGENAYLIYK